MSTGEVWGIRMENLQLGYPGVVVLDEVDADLPAGKISVILGGSGCGKSTLLRHIVGLQRPFRGRILLGERDLFRLGKREFRNLRRRMGVLFQDGALLGSLTLGENVALPLREHTRLSSAAIDAVVKTRLELVGLADFAHRFPGQLSGGMRKRAGLARAIVLDPPVLLCDEPTSGLDPVNAAQMDQLLLDMNELYGVTIVVVSHDLSSLRKLADYVLVLNEGRVGYAGDLAGLEATEDPYLRRFLDRIPDRAGMMDVAAARALLAASLSESEA